MLTIGNLPTEVLERVFTFLTAWELVMCLRTRKSWKELLDAPTDGDHPWKAACMCCWRGKAAMPFAFDGAKQGLFHGLKLTPKGIEALSIKDLRQVLRDRGVDFSTFLEKEEFKAEFIRTSKAHATAFDNKWKASFVSALKDSRRNEITAAELTSRSWRFFMKEHSGFEADFEFLPDGKVRSNMRQGLSSDSRWKFLGANPRSVQVDDYPPLFVSRREDWGFRLENHYVLFYSNDYTADMRKIFEDDMELRENGSFWDFSNISTRN